MTRVRAKARTKRVVGRLLNRLARRKTKVAKVADRLPNRLVSQVKSMGRLMRRLASRERITVRAGNMAADTDMTMIARVDKVMARANRCLSHPLLLS